MVFNFMGRSLHPLVHLPEFSLKVKEEERRKKEEIGHKKAMQRQTIEAFVESKRRWEEREKERIRLEEAKIEEFIGKKDVW
jgi:hypothetical protein